MGGHQTSFADPMAVALNNVLAHNGSRGWPPSTR
jgi:hypothetical protein